MKKKIYRAEGGFTLVELLVTIAILAVLFGIVTLSLTGVGTDAEDTVIAAECGVVQSAIDIYMAEQNVDTITAYTGVAREVVDTDDFAGFLRHLPTKYTYTWEDTGILTCAELP